MEERTKMILQTRKKSSDVELARISLDYVYHCTDLGGCAQVAARCFCNAQNPRWLEKETNNGKSKVEDESRFNQ